MCGHIGEGIGRIWRTQTHPLQTPRGQRRASCRYSVKLTVSSKLCCRMHSPARRSGCSQQVLSPCLHRPPVPPPAHYPPYVSTLGGCIYQAPTVLPHHYATTFPALSQPHSFTPHHSSTSRPSSHTPTVCSPQ